MIISLICLLVVTLVPFQLKGIGLFKPDTEEVKINVNSTEPTPIPKTEIKKESPKTTINSEVSEPKKDLSIPYIKFDMNEEKVTEDEAVAYLRSIYERGKE